MSRSFKISRLQARTLAVIVFLVGMGMSAVSGFVLHRSIYAEAKHVFEGLAHRTSSEVSRRFKQPIYGLNGAKGAYAVKGSLSRYDFRNYVKTRNFSLEFPGVRGFGMIERVQRSELDTFIQTQRRDYAPTFDVHSMPQAELSDMPDLYVIKYIEPLNFNKGAWGLDLGSDPIRREAIEKAINTGLPTVTGRITLVQDTKKSSGVLVYVPFYINGMPLDTVEDHQRALAGIFYAPIVISELLEHMEEVDSGLMDFEIYDSSGDISLQHLMYDADHHMEHLFEYGVEKEIKDKRIFSIQMPLELPGRRITIAMNSTLKFEQSIERREPWLLFFMGLCASGLFSFIILLQSARRLKAEAAVDDITQNFEHMAMVVKHTSNAVSFLDLDGYITWVNEGFTRITGYSLDEAKGQTAGQLLGSGKAPYHTLRQLMESFADARSCRVEIINKTKTGREYWVDTEIQPQRNSAGVLIGFMEVSTDITESKMYSLEIDKNIKSMESIIQNLPCGIVVVDSNMQVTQFNPLYLEFMQYPLSLVNNSGTIEFKKFIEFNAQRGEYGPYTSHKVEEVLDEYKTQTSTQFERIRDDGLTLDVRRVPMPDGGFVVTYTDVTESKKANLQLAASLRDNHALLSALALHGIISVTDQHGVITEVNDSFCEISGYTRDEILGQSHQIFSSKQHQTDFWRDMWRTISCGLPWRGQTCNRKKNGDLYWLDTFIAPFIGDDGQIAKYISIRTDITASKHAENELRLSQSLMEMMSNSSPMGFLVVDNRTDEILYFNQRFCEVWGIEHLAERMHRKELKNNDIIPDCLAVLADVAAFAESCKPLQCESNRITLEDEIAFTYNRTVRRFTTQIRDANDQYFGRFYIFEDVTLSKHNELHLKEMIDKAQQASETKSQFLANMSHEIRTPMNAILGMLTLLRKTELTKKQEDYATKSEGAARSLLGIINEILDFSKIEAGKMTLDPHPFSMNQLLRDLSVILSAGVGDKAIDVLFDIDPDLPSHLLGDAMRIQQIITNLGSNAIKFTSKGEVILSVKVLHKNNQHVTMQIAVHDTGIGIAPENQARIFSGFTQAEASTTRRFGGTGLGVVISTRFVRMMGGQMELDSVLGEGCTFSFTITLPIVEDSVKLFEGGQALDWKVLVVDDNAVALSLLENMGSSLGWNVETALNGENALNKVHELLNAGQGYDVIFIDWQMPGLDGWDTIAKLRTFDFKAIDKEPLIIMSTAHGREMLSQKTEQEQNLLDGFLVKPITASMLYDAAVDAKAHKYDLQPTKSLSNTVTKRLEGMKIVLVEDNINNQQVAMELLTDEGASVKVANHGLECVELLTQTPTFDIVLMDLQMPVMDGFEATRNIRQQLGLLSIPIIAMTANAMTSDKEACISCGMNDHVGKPFDINNLVHVLRKNAGWTMTEDVKLVDPMKYDPILLQHAKDAKVDMDGALSRLGGNQAIYTNILESFIKELVTIGPVLEHTLSQGDYGSAKRQLHTLKGLSSTIGASQLSIEAAASEKKMTQETPIGEIYDATVSITTAIQTCLPSLTILSNYLKQIQVQNHESDIIELDDTQFDAVISAVEHLMSQLREEDMEAMNSMSQINDLLGGAYEAEFRALNAAMSDMDFEESLRCCELVLNALTDPA